MDKYEANYIKDLVRWSGLRYAVPCNSPLSASLLAVSSLTSHILGSKALKFGDEIITTAGNPLTTNATIISGCVPVYVDISLSTHNTLPKMVSAAITEKTKAIFLSHTLGNPFDVLSVRELADANELYLIEDCTQAVGATFDGNLVGTYGDLSTFSLDGGFVLTDSPMLAKIASSFCNCGCNNDFTHIGYNIQISSSQITKSSKLIWQIEIEANSSRVNWEYLHTKMDRFEKYFILPTYLEDTSPRWEGFAITIKDEVGFTKKELSSYLEDRGIRVSDVLIDLLNMPAYLGRTWRISDDLPKSNVAIDRSLSVGYMPKISKEAMDYIAETITTFIGEHNENGTSIP